MTREEALKQLGELKFALSGTDEQFLDIVALDMAIKALEQEPCNDAISRQTVIDVIERWLECSGYNEAERHIMRAVQSVLCDSPSVNPQEPKTGHWIMTGDYLITACGNVDYVKCSCCREYSLEKGDYCPSCGARMIESEGV